MTGNAEPKQKSEYLVVPWLQLSLGGPLTSPNPLSVSPVYTWSVSCMHKRLRTVLQCMDLQVQTDWRRGASFLSWHLRI